MSFAINFIRFSRLHTVIGTTLSLLALYLIARSFAADEKGDLIYFLLTWISCLGANIFIVGLNQLTDVEIDRINKPYLPLASGAFSMRTGKTIIATGLIISLLLALYLGGYLLLTVLLSLALGIAYSLPPIRLKRFSFWAAFCIIAVRGFIVNLLLFLHFHHYFSGLHQIPPLIWLLTLVIFIYSLIIAWFKDLPDTEGDKLYNIRTLSVSLGRLKVFRIGNAILISLFILLVSLPFLVDLNIAALPFAGAHLLFLLLLLWQIQKVNLANQTAVFAYYRFIWILFFMEYAVFAFM